MATRVDEGTTVDLTVGTGPDAITVPNVVGLTEDEARANLENAGLQPGSVSTRQVYSLADEGRVVAIDAGAGVAGVAEPGDHAERLARHIKLPDVAGQDRGRGAGAS